MPSLHHSYQSVRSRPLVGNEAAPARGAAFFVVLERRRGGMSPEELKLAIDTGCVVTACMYVRPKLRRVLVVSDEDVERAIQVILTHARSGEIGDGKIFVMPVLDAVRIRTGERGEGVVAAHDEAATTA
jgi:Nitrogen regulatory protein P-II